MGLRAWQKMALQLVVTGIFAFYLQNVLEMDLAMKIVEYYGIAVHKSYPVGRVIRDYWMAKAREEYW